MMLHQKNILCSKKLLIFSETAPHTHFLKQKPNIVSYRSYKRFCNNSFRTEPDNELLKYDLCNIEYQHFLSDTHTENCVLLN